MLNMDKQDEPAKKEENHKIDSNLAYFGEKEYSSKTLKGQFTWDSDARRRSVEWMSDLAVVSAGLALLFRIITRIIPLGMGVSMLFSVIIDVGIFVGTLLTIISVIFVVPLYIRDKKRVSGALGTTFAAVVETIIYFLITF